MRNIVLICIALIVIIFAVYMQVGNYQFVILDDDAYVVSNRHVANGITGKNIIWAFSTVYKANWHPITWLSHMADVQLYGMNPHGHHLTNVVFHIASTLLLLILLLRLTGAFWQSSFVAALFALHPLHVESVAWVAERKDVLSAFFWFLTLILYVEFLGNRKPALYILSLISFMLGLMSKPMLVTLPVVMILIDFWPLNRFQTEEKDLGVHELLGRAIPLIYEKIPFFACSLLSAAVTIYAQNKGGAIRNIDVIPFMLRIKNILTAYVTYIGKTLWPHDLAVFYPFPLSIPLWQVICSGLVLILISTAAIRAWRRHPYFAMGWLWFLITLVPVIGLIQVGEQSLADRYSYIPLIGLFVVVAWGVADMTKGLHNQQSILALLAGAVLISSASLTWQQTRYWRDSISLFQHALQVTTRNDFIHYSLGNALASKGDLDAAILEYQEALRISPNSTIAHNNLGAAHAKKGDLTAAIQEYQEALRVSPNDSEAYNNLGGAFAGRGDTTTAIQKYRDALRINPNYSVAHNNLGIVLASKGALDEAIQEYQEALRIEPDYSTAHINLGLALATKGELDAAIQEFKEALRINPEDAMSHNNLGFALATKGELDAAIQEFKEALRINPEDEMSHNNLEDALTRKLLRNKVNK